MCCDPEAGIEHNGPEGYEDSWEYGPDSLPYVEMLQPAGNCSFSMSYFPEAELSQDGLCIGTVTATW